MAVRLTVLLIHTNPPTPAADAINDAIIGELIGAPGIDMTLVGAPSTWLDGSTDLMSVESLPSDFAVLDWASTEQILLSLNKVVPGLARAPHRGDPDAPATQPGERRTYVFDLNRFESADLVVQSLRGLLADRQVKTFGLQGMLPPKRSPSVQPTASSNSVKQSPLPIAKEGTQASTSKQQDTAPQQQNTTNQKPLPTRRPSSLDLDDLMDQLDSIDP